MQRIIVQNYRGNSQATVRQQSLTVYNLVDVRQRRCFPAGENVFFLEESELVQAKDRHTALCRVVVVVVTHEAIESTHQVVVDTLEWFRDQMRSDYAFAEERAHIA